MSPLAPSAVVLSGGEGDGAMRQGILKEYSVNMTQFQTLLGEVFVFQAGLTCPSFTKAPHHPS